eukprot:gene57539-biopygen50994
MGSSSLTGTSIPPISTLGAVRDPSGIGKDHKSKAQHRELAEEAFATRRFKQSHKFCFVRAQLLRDWSTDKGPLPRHQELRDWHGIDWIEERELDLVHIFWTLYESWLSMRSVGANGLVAASEDDYTTSLYRFTIVCIGAAKKAESIHVEGLIESWMPLTPEQACQRLMEDDIVVTNQKDKQVQLGVLRGLQQYLPSLYVHLTGSVEKGDV